MKFIYGINNVNLSKGCVLTIGNFDGVHLGHKYLLNILCKEGYNRKLPVIVILFEPHPVEFFTNQSIYRITCLRRKLYYLSKAGIDLVICMHFNKYLSSNTPEMFMNLLVNKLSLKFLIIGKDFRFGYNRTGDFISLKEFGIKYGFKVVKIKNFYIKKNKVSSSLIRKLLLQDKLKEAQYFLGRPFYIFGKVIYGNAFGRKIGFPTANISLNKYTPPIKGIYAVFVYEEKNKIKLPGIANIGIRPTLLGEKVQCEVHIFNICINLYGKYIYVEIIKKIRKEEKFSSVYILKKQIIQDIKIAKNFFGLK